MTIQQAQHQLTDACEARDELNRHIFYLRKCIRDQGGELDTDARTLYERNSQIYSRRLEGASTAHLATEFNLTQERIRTICHREAHKADRLFKDLLDRG